MRDSGLYCHWTTLPLSEAGPMGRAMVRVYAGLTTQFNKQHHSVLWGHSEIEAKKGVGGGAGGVLVLELVILVLKTENIVGGGGR